MKIDLSERLTIGFALGIVGLTVELVGGLLGATISGVLVGAFVSIIVASFGVGIVSTAKKNGEDHDN